MAEQSVHDVVNQTLPLGERTSTGVSGISHKSNITGGGKGTSDIEAEGHEQLLAHTGDSAYAHTNGITSHETAATDSHQQSAPEIEARSDPVSTHFSVNGDSASHVGSDDLGYQNSHGTGAGSDTETSKGETHALSKDGAVKHERSNSTSINKKLASFKTVSVTKNFLAKTGVATPTTNVKSTGDKASSTPQLALATLQPARPRLVAKSDRTSRLVSATTSAANVGGPDAAKVWNRNQPVQPPPPKRITDEELKQQYGIHLATRLQADENGKESKWADIDDDEDDWAPETVEWMDGTKSTILGADALVAPSTDTPQSSERKQNNESPKPEAETPSRTSTISGPGKTILRPGVRSTPSSSLKPGLVLKSVPEKPADEPKASNQNSHKSPWAALPPVDKVSPVSFVPPPQHVSGLPLSSRSHLPETGMDQSSLPPAPAREMTADDFDRSWRDSERGSRELFNSQSGRYEPVKDRENRRRPSRTEPGLRQPAVLQRPSQGDYPGPSAAFQTSRSSGAEYERGSYENRRGSVNSHSPLTENRVGLFDRRASVSANEVAMTGQAKSGTSPPDSKTELENTHANTQIHSSQPEASTEMPQTYTAHSSEHQRDEAPTVPAGLDVRAVQRKLMLEKAELARKKRQEEEAKSEAEKQERIRRKLASLGHPSENEPKKVEVTKVQSTSDVSDSTKASPVSVKVSPSATNEAKATVPKASPPEKHDPVAPIGKEMKVNQETASNSAGSSPPFLGQTATSKQVPSSSKAASREGQQLPKAPSEPDSRSALTTKAQGLNSLQSSRSTERHPPLSWSSPSLGVDASARWTTSNLSSSSKGSNNVWGPPSNDRTLGNGVFDASFQGLATLQPPNHAQSSISHAPGPIAPPGASPKATIDSKNSSSVPPLHFESLKSTTSPAHAQESSHRPVQTSNGGSQSAQSNVKASQQNFVRNRQPEVSNVQASWSSFSEQLQRAEVEAIEQSRKDYEARMSVHRQPVVNETPRIYHETFRKTQSGNSLGERRLVSVATNVHHTGREALDPIRAPASNNQQSQAPGSANQYPQPANALPSHVNGPVNSRASRFFGPGTERASAPPTVSRNHTAALELPQAPEISLLPDSIDHLFAGLNSHPNVNIPRVPRVKLPPPQQVHTPSHDVVIMPTQHAPIRSGSQPIVASTDWQTRFNGLLGKAPVQGVQPRTSPLFVTPKAASPPKPQALAIAPSSKAPLDSSARADMATVSLPQKSSAIQPNQMYASRDDYVRTMPPAEEIMDEPTMGSVPTVRVPRIQYKDHRDDYLARHKFRVPARCGPTEWDDQWSSSIKRMTLDGSGHLSLYVDPEKTSKIGTVTIAMLGIGPISKSNVAQQPTHANQSSARGSRNNRNAKFEKKKHPQRGEPVKDNLPTQASQENHGRAKRQADPSAKTAAPQRGWNAKPVKADVGTSQAESTDTGVKAQQTSRPTPANTARGRGSGLKTKRATTQPRAAAAM